MPPVGPEIVGLEWDEQNEQHIERHLDPWLIEEMIQGGDWFAFSNYQGHSPQHTLFIGRSRGGIFVTAVLRAPSASNPGIWKPITGWLSTDTEKRRYRLELVRTGRR